MKINLHFIFTFSAETNPIGKRRTLKLTEDEKNQIKSASVNALRKLKLDSSRFEVQGKVSERLRELAAENLLTKCSIRMMHLLSAVIRQAIPTL